MPFKHNRMLLQAYDGVTPVVLRDFRESRGKVAFLLKNLDRMMKDSEVLTATITADDHGDDCNACTMLQNIERRYKHDLSLYRMHGESSSKLFELITDSQRINSARPANYLSLALTTRAIVDNAFRSAVLFMSGDIRVYNKYLMESLSSLKKLKWSTLSQSISSSELQDALVRFDVKANAKTPEEKEKHSSLYADPARTFKDKLDYLRKVCADAAFLPFFDEFEDQYKALSDMVHGGIASLAASTPKRSQIVLNDGHIKFTASAHNLLEVQGLALISVHKLFVNLYLPALVYALSGIENADHAAKKFEELQLAKLACIEGFYF